MNKNYAVFILTCVVLIMAGLFFWRQSRLETLSRTYGQVVALSPSYVSYRSVQLPISGEGLLFYKVQLKEIPFEHNIEKMNIEVSGDETIIGLTGVSFQVDKALRALKGEGLVEDLKTYVPYQSIFTRPLESLALAGIEQVRFNAKLILKNTGVSRQLKGEIQDLKIGKATFTLSLPENNGLVSVNSLTQTPMTTGEFSFEDVGFETPYAAYAKSIGYTPPIQGLTHVRVVMPIKEKPIE